MSVTPCKPKQQYTHDDPAHPYKTTEEYKAYKRALYKKNPDYFIEKAREWRDKNPEWHIQHQREYRRTHPKAPNGNVSRTPKMARAHSKVEYHQPPLAKFCELCPEDDVRPAKMRHHPDYNYPLIFVSVCQACHSNIHVDLRKAKKVECVIG